MTRPIPRPTAETRPFWDGCAGGVLRYQTCRNCATVQLIPRSRCACCHQDALEWNTSQGYGRILSYTVVHRAPTPAFKDALPYAIAIVDMNEGFRLMVNVERHADAVLEIGGAVRIGMREVDGAHLPFAEVLA